MRTHEPEKTDDASLAVATDRAGIGAPRASVVVGTEACHTWKL